MYVTILGDVGKKVASICTWVYYLPVYRYQRYVWVLLLGKVTYGLHYLVFEVSES